MIEKGDLIHGPLACSGGGRNRRRSTAVGAIGIRVNEWFGIGSVYLNQGVAQIPLDVSQVPPGRTRQISAGVDPLQFPSCSFCHSTGASKVHKIKSALITGYYYSESATK